MELKESEDKLLFKELLKQKDITGAQLSRKLNKTRQAVSKWVNGVSEPSLSEVKLISEILGVSVDDILNCFVKGA